MFNYRNDVNSSKDNFGIMNKPGTAQVSAPLKIRKSKVIIFRPYFIWERKIFKSNGFFFLQNLPRFYLYLNLRVLPIEFNPHKFSFVRYVFVEIFEVFLKNDENDENDPLMTK